MTNDTTIPDGFKRCTKCGEVKAATHEFFALKGRRNELRSVCKDCQVKIGRQYRFNNPDIARKYRADHPEDVIEKRKRSKRNYDANPEKKRAKDRQRYAANIEEMRKRNRQKYQKHRETKKAYNDRHRRENRGIYQQAALRRRSRKQKVPFFFSIADHRRALEYWHGYCAVCSRPLRDLFGEIEPHLDHWIALSDPRPENPGTVPTNMVPLCSSCNLSKNAYDPLKWLTRKYGSRKAKQIAQRIEVFFEWTRSQ